MTLLDNSRNFAVTEKTASGKPNDTITLNYTGATIGTNEYISAIIADKSGAQYYGRVAQPNNASGQIQIKIPASLADGTYTLNVFSEQYNGGENDDTKLTDYASTFAKVDLTGVDGTAPTLSGGSATRDSETTATVKFISDEAGEYFYEVVESGTTAPTINTAGTGTSCVSGENTISLTSLSDAGAKDIYIVAKDAVGNVSQPLKITIPAYIAPVYEISADTQLLDFGTVTEGYTQAPAAKTVTITNTGNQDVTVDLPTSTNYIITAGEGFTNDTATLALNGTANFTIQPKTGLGAGDYSETLTISGSNSTSASVGLRFVVVRQSGGSSSGGGVTTYAITVQETGHGTVTVSPKNAAKGKTVTITATPGAGCELSSLTVTDSKGNEIDLTDEGGGVYTFTMPGSRVSIKAAFAARQPEPEPLPFTDVAETAWYADAVRYVYENGLMNGVSATDFDPDGTMNRAMLVTILHRQAGGPSASAGMQFADVAAGEWYTEAVRWAAAEGIVTGVTETAFAPDAPITREQFATILYRYAQKTGADVSVGEDTNILSYADAMDISEYAVPAMQWACGAGVMQGSGGNLSPQGQATRAEAAAMLMRFCEGYAI